MVVKGSPLASSVSDEEYFIALKPSVMFLKLFTALIRNGPNKLECALLSGRLLTLLANIEIDWKVFPGINTPAYPFVK